MQVGRLWQLAVWEWDWPTPYLSFLVAKLYYAYSSCHGITGNDNVDVNLDMKDIYYVSDNNVVNEILLITLSM